MNHKGDHDTKEGRRDEVFPTSAINKYRGNSGQDSRRCNKLKLFFSHW